MARQWTRESPEPAGSSQMPQVTWMILLFLAVAAARSEADLEARLEYLSKFALTTKEAVAAVRNSAMSIQSLATASQKMRDVF
ncbi:MAG: hypothetical protein QME76_08665 [Bacillota bacterium]|nr:hypothetical protein [Bacillota bacterium]